MRGGDNLDEVAVDEHELIEVLVALFLIKFELELVRVHVLSVEDLEGRAEVGVDIRPLVPMLGGHTGQLPRALGSLHVAVLVLVKSRLDLSE